MHDLRVLSTAEAPQVRGLGRASAAKDKVCLFLNGQQPS